MFHSLHPVPYLPMYCIVLKHSVSKQPFFILCAKDCHLLSFVTVWELGMIKSVVIYGVALLTSNLCFVFATQCFRNSESAADSKASAFWLFFTSLMPRSCLWMSSKVCNLNANCDQHAYFIILSFKMSFYSHFILAF